MNTSYSQDNLALLRVRFVIINVSSRKEETFHYKFLILVVSSLSISVKETFFGGSDFSFTVLKYVNIINYKNKLLFNYNFRKYVKN
jgi:hypothetical protein